MVLGSLLVAPAVNEDGPRTTTVLFAGVRVTLFRPCAPTLLKTALELGPRTLLCRVPMHGYRLGHRSGRSVYAGEL